MKILKLFKDAFDKLPDTPDIKEWLHSLSRELTPETFSKIFINSICIRGYNEFLDYEKMCLLFIREFKEEDYEYVLLLITEQLLFEDRHDLYQNIPYTIDNIKNDKKWEIIAKIFIESFNENGTENSLLGLNKIQV